MVPESKEELKKQEHIKGAREPPERASKGQSWNHLSHKIKEGIRLETKEMK